MDAGMDDYVAKPTRLATLSEKLGRWLPPPSTQQAASAPGELAVLDANGVSPESTGASRQDGDGKEPGLSQRALALFQQVNDG